MGLESLTATGFRCFRTLELEFGPVFNVIVGENASGKTSLLEAIFFLGRGRSFRTARNDVLVMQGDEALTVFGTANQKALGVGWQRGSLDVRINRESAGLAELAACLPVLLMDAHSHGLVDGGPGGRRRYLDWGVFHVEHRFLDAWRRYRRALGQRNSLLKRGGDSAEYDVWERELSESGAAVDGYRRTYLKELCTEIDDCARILSGTSALDLIYRCGWADGRSLADILAVGRERERVIGSTQAGPHRADIEIRIDDVPANQRVSRGQQKMLAAILLLAQGRLYRRHTGRNPIILVDDLAAELDQEHRRNFLHALSDLHAQVFITAIDLGDLEIPSANTEKVFHVEHGEAQEMV